MAKLPTAYDLGGLPSARTGRAIASFDTSAVGRGLQNLGKGVSALSDDIYKIAIDEQKKEDDSWLTNRRAKFALQFDELMRNSAEKAEEGAKGYKDFISSRHADLVSSVLEEAPSDSARADFEKWAVGDMVARVRAADKFERDAKVALRRKSYDETVDLIARRTATHPEEWRESYVALEDTLERMGPDFTPAELTARREAYRRKIAEARFRGLVRAGSPTEAIGTLRLGGDAAKRILVDTLVDPSRISHIKGLDDDFAGRLSDMITAAPPEIKGHIKILSGARTKEHQKRLWEAALKKYGSAEAARKWVAPPGRSRHNAGGAVDLRYGSDEAKKWVHENAKRFGLHFRMKHEPWHIEPVKGAHARPRSPIPYERALALEKEARREMRADLKTDIVNITKEADELGVTSSLTEDKVREILAAWGPEAGGDILKEIRYRADVGEKRILMDDKSPAEIAALLAKEKPKEGDPDYALKSSGFKSLEAAAKATMKSRTDDPFSHVVSKTEAGRAAAKVLSEEGDTLDIHQSPSEAKRLAFSDIIREQLRLNGGRRDLVRAMPEDIADARARKINAAKSSPEIRKLIRGIEELYGDNASIAMRDLVKAGMDAALVAVPDMKDPGAGMAVIEAAAYEKENGKGSIRREIKDVASEVDAAYRVEMQKFKATFPEGVSAKTGPYDRAVKLLAEFYVMKRDVKPAQAVKDAYARVIGDRLVVHDTVRIPTEYDTKRIIGALNSGAASDLLRGRVDDVDVSALMGPTVAIRGLAEKDVRLSYANAFLAMGTWATAPDYSGIIRLDSKSIPVLGKDGKPIIIPWSALESVGVAAEEESKMRGLEAYD